MSVFCYILILSNLRFITLFKWTEKQVTKRILSTPSEKVFQGLTFSTVSKKAHYTIIFLLYSLFNYCSGKNYVLFPFQYFSVNLCLISNICTKKPHQFSSKSPQTFNLTGLGTPPWPLWLPHFKGGCWCLAEMSNVFLLRQFFYQLAHHTIAYSK